MTSFLRLNGIDVPVQDGSANLTQEDIGSETRAADGTPVFNRRTTKRKWSLRTSIRTAAEALAFRDLVTGKGHVINFDANNYYSSKGLAPTTIGGGWSITATLPKFGGFRAAHTVTNTSTWTAFTSTSPWSISLWRTIDGGTTWNHWLLLSDGTKYLNGVLSVAASAFCTVAAGVVTLGNDVAGGFDDVVFLPTLVPSSWAASIFNAGFAFGALPRLSADGSFVEQNAVISVKGVVGDMKPYQGALGSYAANLHDFAFELKEV